MGLMNPELVLFKMGNALNVAERHKTVLCFKSWFFSPAFSFGFAVNSSLNSVLSIVAPEQMH